MGNKTRRHGRHDSAVGLFEQAERRFETHHFKEAYRDAKACYRQQPTPQHRSLLERAWFARARELTSAGLRTDGRKMLEDLLAFGVTEPSVRDALPEVLVSVGLFDRMGGGKGGPAVEVDADLLATAADHAVLKPAEASASLPGIRQGAAGIRSALDALYAADESAALASLKDIPRNSPFADWRYFVRGLAAYYRQDFGEMAANWDRLDPARAAARIARALKALADPPASCNGDPQARSAARLLETQLSGQPVLQGLLDLKSALAGNRWKDVMRGLRRWRGALGQLSPELLDRLTSFCVQMVVSKGEPDRLRDLTLAIRAPAMDPHWNRAWAMLWGHPDLFRFREAEQRWQAYLKDVDDLPGLTPEERRQARALIWMHMARLCVRAHDAEDDSWLDEGEWDATEASDEDVAALLRARAVAYFHKSIELEPKLLAAYEMLADAYLEWDEEEKAAETYRRLLERFPDHLDALQFLIRHHIRRDECLLVRDYALRAWRLKPTNPQILGLVWAGHVGAARHYALRGEWDKGRAEFDAAEKINAPYCEPYLLLARRAAFEMKAGNVERGWELAAEAKAQLPHPAPALLVLAIEATRYGLPNRVDGVVAQCERDWMASLKRKRLSSTAGRMARTVLAYLAGGVDYRGRQAHLDRVVGYLRACARIRWQCDDLLAACELLREVSGKDESAETAEVWEKLARRGCKLFPESPVFFLMAGDIEFAKGPIQCNRRHARRCYERVVELAEKTAPADASMVEHARRQLSLLDRVSSRHPFAFRVPPFGSVEEEEEEDDDPPGAPPPRMPRGKLFSAFAKVCASMGLDPREVLDRIAGGTPFRFGRSPAEDD